MYLSQFEENSLCINWTTLFIGLTGLGETESLLNTKDVIDYATRVLATIENPEDKDSLIAVASADPNDYDYVASLLRRMSRHESMHVESRKWRVLMLLDLLEKLPENPLYGLLRLTEFWASFNYPDDSPHVIQGRGNNYTPEVYFTKKNYDVVLTRHRNWIEEELVALRCRT